MHSLPGLDQTRHRSTLTPYRQRNDCWPGEIENDLDQSYNFSTACSSSPSTHLSRPDSHLDLYSHHVRGFR